MPKRKLDVNQESYVKDRIIMSTCSDDNELYHTNGFNKIERNDLASVYSNMENDLVGLHQLYLKGELAFPRLGITADNSAKRRVKNFSLQEKVKVLDDVKLGRPKAEVRKEYGIGESTLRRWVHDEQKIRDALQEENASRKKLRIEDNPYVSEALIAWYNSCRQQNLQMSNLMLREKASEFNKLLGVKENIASSSDWLDSWSRRKHEETAGQSQSQSPSLEPKPATLDTSTDKEKEELKDGPIEDSAVRQLRMTLTTAVEEESMLRCQIFKCDKAVLQYRSVPGGDRADDRDRVSTMTCSNADGSLKLPLVVLEPALQAPALARLQTSLPVFYAPQGSDQWKEADVLNQWFDNEFTPRVTDFLRSRALPLKAILVAENVPSDVFQDRPTSELQIHLILHNLSLVIGPMVDESLESLRLNYLHKMLRSMLSAQEDGEEAPRVGLRDFLYWVSDAWDDVSSASIVACWKKFLEGGDDDGGEEAFDLSRDEREVDAAVVHGTLRRLRGYRDVSENEVVRWIDRANKIAAHTNANERLRESPEEANRDSNADDEAVNGESKNVSARDALKGLNSAIAFFEQNGLASVAEMMALVKLKEKALTIKIDSK